MSEQPIYVSALDGGSIIGVDNKANSRVARKWRHLLNPQIDRKLPEYIKQRIILYSSDGYLQNMTNEKALRAAAACGLQMTTLNRHVIGEV